MSAASTRSAYALASAAVISGSLLACPAVRLFRESKRVAQFLTERFGSRCYLKDERNVKTEIVGSLPVASMLDPLL